ncbi:uncharacterized protein NP_1910A [Natronomonas pharaonis DSM 2160]|uniref:HTH domain protein n=1 Tax=Natronomonas pharaonis (strain ATCC 35678 / DSM 2160 / CIP 103997 / JCM 8858 / NBRC 14720 / NCIMB 2260 / Gabara) TaxID=348780 RepID=A0A1U7EVK2_NATPD|nr:DUF5821 family protein [Natronomonas pharaonis]CAI49046.1 uncharacterized protein NP_1910A [Natronomonas pharaonis DSM 2160]
METAQLESGVVGVVETAFTDGTDSLVVVDPSEETLAALVSASFDRTLPTLLVLAEERTLKDAMGDFVVASKAAALVEEGDLSLRVLSEPADNSVFAAEDQIVAPVPTGDGVAALSTDDGVVVDDVYESYHDRFETALDYDLRTPSITRVRETLEEALDEQTRADFDAVLEAVPEVRSRGDSLDEVSILLLLTAKNGNLLYDISKWGEDVGVASKATFSRTKTDLEDAGLLDTEKVPIDVGRPRLRLKLGDNRLQGRDAVDLVETAADILN